MQKLFSFAFLIVLLGAGCLSASDIASDVSGDPVPTGENSENIVLDFPEEGSAVSSPMRIQGEARVFENTLEWEVRSVKGAVLGSGFFTYESEDVGEFGEFNESIRLPVMSEEDFIFDLFWTEPRNGERADVVSRSYHLPEIRQTKVNVFFIDPELQAGGDCSEVDFEKRSIARAGGVDELALIELIEGPESDWAVSNVPEGTQLNSVDIDDDNVATVDFFSDNPSRWQGDSCYTQGLRAQIEQTLLQFTSIESVVITVNGGTKGILE